MAEARALVHTLDSWAVVETMVVPTKTPDRKLVFGKGTLEQLTGGSRAPSLPALPGGAAPRLSPGASPGSEPGTCRPASALGAPGHSEWAAPSPALPPGCPLSTPDVGPAGDPAFLGPLQSPPHTCGCTAQSSQPAGGAHCLSVSPRLRCIQSPWGHVMGSSPLCVRL